MQAGSPRLAVAVDPARLDPDGVEQIDLRVLCSGRRGFQAPAVLAPSPAL